MKIANAAISSWVLLFGIANFVGQQGVKAVFNQNLVGISCCLFAAIFMIGCSGQDSKSMIANANDLNVKRLATVYSFFHLKNNFKGPKNEAELKKFISDQDPDRMSLAGIDVSDVDSLFTGERDGLPLKIRYGVNTRVRGPSLPVVFEDTGDDEVRQVGFTNGSMREVDAEDYAKMWQGKMDNEKIEIVRE